MRIVKYAFLTFMLALFFSRIIFINSTTQLIGDGGDNFQYFGFMHLAHQNITSFKYPFAHTNTYQYPIGFEFSFGYDGAFPVLTGALLGFIIPLPLAYNIVMLLVLWLNCFIAFICFSKIGKLFNSGEHSQLYYLIPAVMYGWSPYVFGRLNGHVNLAFIAGFPLFSYAVLLFITKIKRGNVLKLSHYLFLFCSVLVIAGGSLQYLILLSQLSVALILCCFIFFVRDTFFIIQTYIKSINMKQISYFLTSCILFLSVFLFFYSGYISALLTKQFVTVGVNNNSPLFIPSLIDFFVPNSYLGPWWKPINSSLYELERIASYGMIGNLVLILYFLQNKYSKQSLIILTAFFATVVFGKYIPPILIPEPGRVFVGFSLIVCVILAIKQPKWPFIFLVLITTVLIGERLLFRIQATQPINIKVTELIKKLPGKAVLSIPISGIGYRGALAYFWGKSIIDGSLHYPARTKSIYRLWESPLLSKFICRQDQLVSTFTPSEVQDLISLLKKLDIQTIVLHKKAPGERWWFKECAQVRESWYSLNPQNAQPSSTESLTLHKFEYGRNAPIQSKLIFENPGIIELGGMTIWPPKVDDFSIATMGGVIYPQWRLIENSKVLVADFKPSISLYVASGERFILSSKKLVDDNTNLELYYRYTPYTIYTKNSRIHTLTTSPLKQIYTDEDIEVYLIR